MRRLGPRQYQTDRDRWRLGFRNFIPKKQTRNSEGEVMCIYTSLANEFFVVPAIIAFPKLRRQFFQISDNSLTIVPFPGLRAIFHGHQLLSLGCQLIREVSELFFFISNSTRAAIHSSRDTTLCSRARLFGSDVIILVLIFSFLAPSAKAEASTVTTKERAPSGHPVVDDGVNPWRVFGSAPTTPPSTGHANPNRHSWFSEGPPLNQRLFPLACRIEDFAGGAACLRHKSAISRLRSRRVLFRGRGAHLLA